MPLYECLVLYFSYSNDYPIASKYIGVNTVTQIAKFMGQHGAHLGPVGPRWAPFWPHEPWYQGTSLKSWLIFGLEVIDPMYKVSVNDIKYMDFLIYNQCVFTGIQIWHGPDGHSWGYYPGPLSNVVTVTRVSDFQMSCKGDLPEWHQESGIRNLLFSTTTNRKIQNNTGTSTTLRLR